MQSNLTLYHGNDHPLPKPLFGYGSTDNDYGQGFYTTEDYERAKEWALSFGNDNACVNKYIICVNDLKVIHLDDYGVLTWIAEIVKNRGARGEAAQHIATKLIQNYSVDLSDADIIIGYRADDSYSDIVDAFLKNEIDLTETARLFKKGHLGEQIFIKSQKAFDALTYQGYDNTMN